MAMFEVQILGSVPDCLLIEAGSEDEACDKATDAVLDMLEFNAAPAEEAGAGEAQQPKCGKARKRHGGKTKQR